MNLNRKSVFLFLLFFIPVSVTLSQPQNFIRGVDVSFLDEIENHGGVFKENGIPRDALSILHNHGINYVRLRLWHTPSGGYNNLQRTLLMAARVKQLGMKFLLNVHYSDSWADPRTTTSMHPYRCGARNRLLNENRRHNMLKSWSVPPRRSRKEIRRVIERIAAVRKL